MHRKQLLRVAVLLGSIMLGSTFYLIWDKSELIGQAVSQGTFPNSEEKADVIVVHVDDGYEPNMVTITKGQTVLWVNESSEFHWPTSNIHPTHRLYSKFDSLKPIAPGESWEFTFTKAGEWHFHDHLRANKGGIVIVNSN